MEILAPKYGSREGHFSMVAQSVTEPRYELRSPEDELRSPEDELRSPEDELRSPEDELRSPEHGLRRLSGARFAESGVSKQRVN